MNKTIKQINSDYKQIMNSKSVQEMKELIVSQKVKVVEPFKFKENESFKNVVFSQNALNNSKVDTSNYERCPVCKSLNIELDQVLGNYYCRECECIVE